MKIRGKKLKQISSPFCKKISSFIQYQFFTLLSVYRMNNIDFGDIIIMNNYIAVTLSILWLCTTIILYNIYRYDHVCLHLMDVLFFISLVLFFIFIFCNKYIAAVYFLALCYSGYMIAKIAESC